jgi:hypothetical protein
VGGDRLDYSGDVATSAADITTFKILINSTLSTEDAAIMMMDIKNYYIITPLPRFEYMKMLLSRFPYPVLVCHTRLRRQNPISNERWNTATHGPTMFHNTESRRIHFVLRQSGGPHRFNATEWHYNGTNQGDQKMQAATNQLLDYLATHPDATIRYHASNMILHIHSNASYLSVSNARSRHGDLFFLGNKTPNQDKLNGSILIVASVIKNVVASAAESEVGECFHNAQSGAPLRVTLTEMGHTQPPTPLRTDNSTKFGILNETIRQKRSKAMYMRYHWLTDRVRQKTIRRLLAPRTWKYRWLSHKTSFSATSQRYARIHITWSK